MVEAEKRGGMEASAKILTDLLEEHHLEYDELIMNLQLGATL
jgi:hypothetical protein